MRLGSRARLALVVAAAGLGLGCNVIEAVFSDAHLVEMVAGQKVAGAELGCWLEMEFDRVPEGIDPTDVRVRFESIALVGTSEFDWSYISQNDVVPKAGKTFGSGYRPNPDTRPGAPPPVGQLVKVRFPLNARRVIEDAPSTIHLDATLYWGGKKQSTLRRTIEHVYESEPGSFF